jgi:GNAT superfamily N-acetyltransferase
VAVCVPEVFPDLVFDFPSADVLAADGAFWQLYDSAFPSTEREPRSVVLETQRRGLGAVVRARSSGNTVGLALAHLLRHPPVLFIVYLAVAPELRSRHIGAALFEQLWAAGSRIYSERGTKAEGVVWEVDIPERATTGQGLEQGRRRIAFFQRLGGRLLPAPYFQPPVDGITPVPMHLMFRPAPGRSAPDLAALAPLVRALYFEKYHAANGIPEAVLQDLLKSATDSR